MTEVKLIWAQTNNGTIALEQAIPWHQSTDMRFFKKATLHQVVVMGRHTMASLHGRPLPDRLNLVLTHDEQLTLPAGFERIMQPEEALKRAQALGCDLAVIGGKAIYETYLPLADHLYVTYLDTDFNGDTHMAPVDKTQWLGRELAHGSKDRHNDYAYQIMDYQRR
ncbi:dihydrofolate reductase [Weissella halotolerans]|uniref:Dihydrofolate reductase n=1 Tax=Weissella halotolerans DSM 20190 TaxID=1123500 RepID=A0A0R2G7D3_9LACO|nr:dihydrofolate reductase [Weissella halotolerans]KRN33367.1 dihydrofolate reductase region [Weissella halotolerans DSM 20190]